MTDATLGEKFAEAGEVVEAVVVIDRQSGRSKGFGFVTMVDVAAAQKAIEMFNGQEWEGRKVVVNVARPKEN